MTMQDRPDTRKVAVLVGALFLIAMAASLFGAGLIDGVTTAPAFLGGISAEKSQVIMGVFLELINGIAVIGIAVLMFPIFRKQNEALGLGYVAFRIVEGMIIVAAIITPLGLLTLSQDYASLSAVEASTMTSIGNLLLVVRTHLYSQMLGIFFSLAALIFYYLLYRMWLVPRFIAIWGLLAVVLVFSWNLLELADIHVSFGMFMALPIILNEIFLGIWLIVKGFNQTELMPDSADTVMRPA